MASWRRQQASGNLERDREVACNGAREKHSGQKEQQDAETGELVQAMSP